MNRKAQMNPAIILVGIMVCFVAFVMLVAFISPTKDMVDIGRDSNNLNCESSVDYNSSRNTDGLTCLIADIWLPAFFGIGLAVALALIGIRKLRRREQ